MHNLVAFYESITNGSTYTAVNAVTDQSQTVSANGAFIFPANQRILGAHVSGVNLTAARINTP